MIVEDEAAVVRRMFSERAQGTGISAIAADLNSDGVPSPRGGLWTRQSVRALLRVRAYRGEAHRGEHVLANAHEAIVTAAEWDAAQTDRAPARIPGDSLLSGLVRCAGCGYVLGAGSSRAGRRYNCNRHHSEMRCPSPTTAPADRLELLVAEGFLGRYGDVRVQGASTVDPLVLATETTVERARTEFATWRDDVDLRAAIGDADYRAGLVARKRSVHDAEQAHKDAVRQSRSSSLSVSEDVWTGLDTSERRELLRAGIDAVVLRRASSTSTPLSDRVELLWTGELEHDGTRAGVAAAVRGRP